MIPVQDRWFEIGMLLNIPFHDLSEIYQLEPNNTQGSFIKLLEKFILVRNTFSKEFVLALAIPCGGNNFIVAVQLITFISRIKEKSIKKTLKFWMKKHPFERKNIK